MAENKAKVILTRAWPKAAEDKACELFDAKCNVDDKPMDTAALQRAMCSADALCPTVSDKITREVLDVPGRTVRVLGNFGVGFNHIDIEAAKELGIRVTNTPDVLTDCTADLAVLLMLATARRIGEGERQLRSGNWTGWRPTHMLGHKVSGKALGLIGFGRIARAVARRAHFGFNMSILFYDPYPPNPADLDMPAQSCASTEEVLRHADVVSLHCPGGEATKHLINSEMLSCMQPHALLINTSRGDVIDEGAMAAALKQGLIAGAGLDVYENEPAVPPELMKLENVVLAPHLGSATTETRVAMGLRATENVRAFFAGETPPDTVV